MTSNATAKNTTGKTKVNCQACVNSVRTEETEVNSSKVWI